jgi:hypothetical protein
MLSAFVLQWICISHVDNWFQVLTEDATDLLKTYQNGKMKPADLETFLDTAIESSNMILHPVHY